MSVDGYQISVISDQKAGLRFGLLGQAMIQQILVGGGETKKEGRKEKSYAEGAEDTEFTEKKRTNPRPR
jgi:hypothetical protein